MTVVVEGIENKVKKLIIRNKNLKEKILHLETEKQRLTDKIEIQSRQIQQLNNELAHAQIAGSLVSGDSSHARQKLQDLLREIERCQTLLNR